MIKIIIVCVLAGMGAGLGTGFAGLSAAVFISPLLITFLDVSAYEATALGLLSDVLASALSSYTYYRHGNIDLKHSRSMMTAVFVTAIVGSLVAFFVPNSSLGMFTTLGALLMGCMFIKKGFADEPIAKGTHDVKHRTLVAILGGVYVGFVCGFIGTGGGLMMLILLTAFLRYDLHTAVGTSTFIMTFTALLGSGAHFVINKSIPEWYLLVLCIASTSLFALLAARLANRLQKKQMNLITGVLLLIVGVLTLCHKLFF